MFGFCKYVPRNLFYSVQLPLFPNRHFSWQIFWLIIAGKAPVLLITNHGSVSCIGVPVCRLSLCVMSNVFREEGANFSSVSILYKLTAFGRTSAPLEPLLQSSNIRLMDSQMPIITLAESDPHLSAANVSFTEQTAPASDEWTCLFCLIRCWLARCPEQEHLTWIVRSAKQSTVC